MGTFIKHNESLMCLDASVTLNLCSYCPSNGSFYDRSAAVKDMQSQNSLNVLEA